jgi:hypothetical protein
MNRPFTNGAHYIHNTINFYLRRQDPFGEYGLQYCDADNPMTNLTPYGDYKDTEIYEYYSTDNFYNSCSV